MDSQAQPAATYENDEQAANAFLKVVENSEAPPEEAKEEPKEEPKAEAQPETEAEPDSKIEIDPEAAIFEVEEVEEGGGKVNRKYSLNQLKAQRMMQADYQRKTAELARQREKSFEDSRQAVEVERQRFLTSAQSVQKALFAVAAQEFQSEGVNLTDQFAVQAFMGRLAKDDPAKYVQMSNRLNEINSHINLVSRTIEQETAKTRQEKQQAVSKKAQEAWEILGRDIKDWNEEAYSKLLKVGYEYGFKPEEIANPVAQDGSIADGYIPAVDHRFIKLLHDANAYRQQQKQQPIVEKKVAAAPKVLKPGAPAKADNKQRQDEANSRLKKSGKLDDAANAFLSMMR